MPVTSALNDALSGIRKGLAELDRTAGRIAGGGAFKDAADLAQSMVALQEDRRQVELSAKVMKSVDDTLGTLLDVTA
jgi:hypothetical protein